MKIHLLSLCILGFVYEPFSSACDFVPTDHHKLVESFALKKHGTDDQLILLIKDSEDAPDDSESGIEFKFQILGATGSPAKQSEWPKEFAHWNQQGSELLKNRPESLLKSSALTPLPADSGAKFTLEVNADKNEFSIFRGKAKLKTQKNKDPFANVVYSNGLPANISGIYKTPKGDSLVAVEASFSPGPASDGEPRDCSGVKDTTLFFVFGPK